MGDGARARRGGVLLGLKGGGGGETMGETRRKWDFFDHGATAPHAAGGGGMRGALVEAKINVKTASMIPINVDETEGAFTKTK